MSQRHTPEVLLELLSLKLNCKVYILTEKLKMTGLTETGKR